jgi:hypothetical protein
MIEVNFVTRKASHEGKESRYYMAWQAPFHRGRHIMPLQGTSNDAELHLFVVLDGEQYYIGPVTRGNVSCTGSNLWRLNFVGTTDTVDFKVLFGIDLRTEHMLRVVYPHELIRAADRRSAPQIMDEVTVEVGRAGERNGVSVLL